MTEFSLSRRALLAIGASSAATACAPFDKRSPFWGTMAAGVGGLEANAPSREYADQLPYASTLAWFDGAPRALLVLSQIDPGGRFTWVSAERQVIVTVGPFIVAALGFEPELRATALGGAWNPNPLQMSPEASFSRTLDVAVDHGRVQVHLNSTFRQRDRDEVEILGRHYQLTRVTEEVSYQGRPRYSNQFWVDQVDGRTWKSRQRVIPTLPWFNMEVLKYPAA